MEAAGCEPEFGRMSYISAPATGAKDPATIIATTTHITNIATTLSPDTRLLPKILVLPKYGDF